MVIHSTLDAGTQHFHRRFDLRRNSTRSNVNENAIIFFVSNALNEYNLFVMPPSTLTRNERMNVFSRYATMTVGY